MTTPLRIFLSYKSNTAPVARLVADALIANGVVVWFAEYEVLLGNYDDFQDAIDVGIDQSDYALLFTNRDWAKSKYCQIEICRVMQRIPTSRILRVEIPPSNEPENVMHWVRTEILRHSPGPCRPVDQSQWTFSDLESAKLPQNVWPPADDTALNRSPDMTWSGEVEDVLSFVSEYTGLLEADFFVPAACSEASRWTWQHRGTGLSIKLGVFSPRVDPDGTISGSSRNGVLGMFDAQVDGLSFTMFLQASTSSSVLDEIVLPPEKQHDDRQIYHAFRNYARTWLISGRNAGRGLHLAFGLGPSRADQGQFALTYSERALDGASELWQRRFVIPLSNNGPGELGVVFGLKLPIVDGPQNLRTFCRYTRIMESIVDSLEITPPARWNDVVLTMITVRGILAALAVWGMFYGSAVALDLGSGYVSVFAFLAGVFVGDFAMSFVPAVGKIMSTCDLHTNRLQVEMSTYERLSNLWYEILWWSLGGTVTAVLLGAVNLIVVLLIAISLFLGVTKPAVWIGIGCLTSIRGTMELIKRWQMH